MNNVGRANASLNVYPNPNQGEFTLNLSSSVSEEAVVTVTNIVGQKVKEFTIITNKETNVTLDQPAGLYLLTANTTSGKYSAKVTIAK